MESQKPPKIVETNPTQSFHKIITIDGNNLKPEHLNELSHGQTKIKLSEEAEKNVKNSRKVIDNIVSSEKVVYGVNTGFGNFASVTVEPSKLKQLQINLIRSHCVGVGKPLSKEHTRALMALRINILAKGYSGISFDTLQRMIDAFNSDCLPYVPEQGTVGASGDLAPLAHLALGLMGEGKMSEHDSDNFTEAAKVLQKKGVKPLELKEKEGLALINGTQFITSLGAEALIRAETLVKTADIIAAFTAEVLYGVKRAYYSKIHEIRNHPGQIESAATIRSLIHSSENPSDFDESKCPTPKVQDGYTLRCIPQVHGIVHDTLKFIRPIIEREMNAATDNPLVFLGDDPYDVEKFAGVGGFTISGGNFHGEYPAKALDMLCMTIHELSSISERRTERMVNPNLSKNLEAFLIKEGGLNSGFMMAHVTAAALVSENKVLCHPSSVDSIPTSAGQEDHVSMGGWAARKCLMVIENVEKVLAIELMAACQALDLQRPRKATEKLEKLHHHVREVAKVDYMTQDYVFSEYIERLSQEIRNNNIVKVVTSSH